MLLCFLGMLCAGATLVQKYTIGAWVHRNPLALIALLLFVVGVQLIGMGLLAELQVRTYHEAQSKPIYKIRNQVNVECVESPEPSRPVAVASMPSRSAK
jgi:dolichol-phosphate mannosyltransferase